MIRIQHFKRIILLSIEQTTSDKIVKYYQDPVLINRTC